MRSAAGARLCAVSIHSWPHDPAQSHGRSPAKKRALKIADYISRLCLARLILAWLMCYHRLSGGTSSDRGRSCGVAWRVERSERTPAVARAGGDTRGWGARRRRAGAVSSTDEQAQPRLLPRRIGARGLLRPRAEKPAYAGRIIIGQQRLISSPEHRALLFPCAQRARGQRRPRGAFILLSAHPQSASISVCNKYIRLTVSTAPGGACARGVRDARRCDTVHAVPMASLSPMMRAVSGPVRTGAVGSYPIGRRRYVYNPAPEHGAPRAPASHQGRRPASVGAHARPRMPP